MDLGALTTLRPVQPWRGFYLLAFLCVPVAWLGWPSEWAGWTALAQGSAGGPSIRFLIDSTALLSVLFCGVLCARLTRPRLRAMQAALQANRVHRYPFIGAFFFATQYPWLLLAYQPADDWVYPLTGHLGLLSYLLPWFAYLQVNSVAVLICGIEARWQSYRRRQNA